LIIILRKNLLAILRSGLILYGISPSSGTPIRNANTTQNVPSVKQSSVKRRISRSFILPYLKKIASRKAEINPLRTISKEVAEKPRKFVVRPCTTQNNSQDFTRNNYQV
jgi:hypothetical protein